MPPDRAGRGRPNLVVASMAVLADDRIVRLRKRLRATHHGGDAELKACNTD